MFLEVVSIFSAMINRVLQKFTRQSKPIASQYTAGIRKGIYPASGEEQKDEASTSQAVAFLHSLPVRKGTSKASATETIKAKGLRIKNGFGRGGNAVEGRRQSKMSEASPRRRKEKAPASLPEWRTSTPRGSAAKRRGSSSKKGRPTTKSTKKGMSPVEEEVLPTAAVVAASLAARKVEGSEPGSLVVEPPSEGVPEGLEEVSMPKEPVTLKSPRRETAKKAPETLVAPKKSPKGRAPTPKKPATTREVVSTQKPKKTRSKSTRRGQSISETGLMDALAAFPEHLKITEESFDTFMRHQPQPKGRRRKRPPTEAPPPPLLLDTPIVKPPKALRRKTPESPSVSGAGRQVARRIQQRKVYPLSSTPRRLQSAFMRNLEEAVKEADAASDAFYDAVSSDAVTGESYSTKEFAPCTPPGTPTPVAGPSRPQGIPRYEATPCENVPDVRSVPRQEATPYEDVPSARVSKKRNVPERKPAGRKGVGAKKIGRKGVSVMAKMRGAHSKKEKGPKQTDAASAPIVGKVCSAYIVLADGRTCTVTIKMKWEQPTQDVVAEKRAPAGRRRKA